MEVINIKLEIKSIVNNLLQYDINPKLAIHGGKVTLIDITDDLLAILKFEGGCNGCSMVSFTIKKCIEKLLIKKIPYLKGVSDITDHQSGEHSYY